MILFINLTIQNSLFAFDEFVDPNPSPGNQFGITRVVLSTGNVVITAPRTDIVGEMNVGAVYLFNGATGELISSLFGSQGGDEIGKNGVIALTNGNFVIMSNDWNNGTIVAAGAVTWGSGINGVSGSVTSSNSLVGTHAYGKVGSSGITALTNGNYVVISPNWYNGILSGAVTWGSGTSGVSGAVSSTNSLVGISNPSSVTALTNGNYVVVSPNWPNGTINKAGAVTWGSGTSGVSGFVTSTNSLVGTQTNDMVGGNGIIALSNGNYVVMSYKWDNGTILDAGAVTWGNGTSGVSGAVTSSNSLVGTHADDKVGYNGVDSSGITTLTNGNYVVMSYKWDNGTILDAGAVTWGSGTSGVSGAVTSSNSLVGTQASDYVGNKGVTALSNGNYVVSSDNWHNGTNSFAGASTWGNGTSGVSGAVTSSNSLVGTQASDYVGTGGVKALSNGNYVVCSSRWKNGSYSYAGAATWGSGTSGVTGAVSSTNSLVGTKGLDQVAIGGVTALTNGNYVVVSYNWINGTIDKAGAVTWGSGTSGVSGYVSSSNSLVGTQTSDEVGKNGIKALTNGSYLVRSSNWDNGTILDAGAVTWGSGTNGVTGAVSSTNSLVGKANDKVGMGTDMVIAALSNGNYVVISNNAATWGSGTSGVSGIVTSSNSLVGSHANDQVGRDGITALSNGNYVVKSTRWDNGTITDAGALTIGDGLKPTIGEVTSNLHSIFGVLSGERVPNSIDLDIINSNVYTYLNTRLMVKSISMSLSVTPTLSTNLISNITANSATSGGNVTSDGGSSISERGVVLHTATNPTTSKTKFTTSGTSEAYITNLSGLSSETQYFIRAFATNTDYTGYGNELNFYTLSNEPTGHSSLTASAGQTNILLNFQAASTFGADGYILLRKQSNTYPDDTNVNDGSAPSDLLLPNGTVLATTITSNSQTSFDDTGLTAANRVFSYALIPFNWDASHSATYNYRTSATIPKTSATIGGPVVSTGTKTNFDTTSITITGSNLTSEGGANVTDRGVVWSTSPNPTIANNKVATNPNPASGTGTYDVNITGLTAGTKYYSRAYATSSIATSYGSEITFYTAPNTQASNITWGSVTRTSITANWTNGNGANRLVLVKKGNPISNTPLTNETVYTANSILGSGSAIDGGSVVFYGTGNSVTVTGLTNNTLYYFRVFESVGSGTEVVYNQNTAATNPTSRNTNRKTGAEGGHVFDFDIQTISPNPANDYIKIDFTLPEDIALNMQIFDLQGNLMFTLNDPNRFTRGHNQQTIDCSNFPSGTYFISMTNGSEAFYYSFVVER